MNDHFAYSESRSVTSNFWFHLWCLEVGEEAKHIVDDFVLLFDVDVVLAFDFVFLVELEFLIELGEATQETILGLLLPLIAARFFELLLFLNAKLCVLSHFAGLL